MGKQAIQDVNKKNLYCDTTAGTIICNAHTTSHCHLQPCHS